MTGRWTVGVVLALASLGPAAQTPPPAQLSIAVREAGTGRPLADVPVSVRLEDYSLPENFTPPPGFEPRSFMRKTGPDGTLVVSTLLPGTYRVHVDSPEHLSHEPRDSGIPVTSRASAEGAAVDEPGAGWVPVRAGARETVTFELRRGATVRGSVATVDGAPAFGVTVELLTAAPAVSYRRFSAWRSATSDAKGQFRFSPLPPGTYYLRTSSKPGLGQYFNDVYYPGMPEPSKASGIDAAAGSDIEVSLLAPFAPRIVVRGRVDPQLTKAGVDLTLRRLTDAEGDVIELKIVPVVQSGQFMVAGLRSGTYLLQARRTGAGDVVVAQAMAEVGTSDLVDVTVAPPAPSRFRARLEVPAGASLEWSDIELAMISPDGVPGSCRSEQGDVKGTIASHRLLLMPPGRCRAMVGVPEGWFADGVLMEDGTNLLVEPARFEEGRDYGELRIRVSNRFARLTGRIPNALMPIRESLFVAAEDPRYGEYSIRSIGALEVRDDGTFEALVAPGRTYLVGLCTGRCVSVATGRPSSSSSVFRRTATRVAVDRAETISVAVGDPR